VAHHGLVIRQGLRVRACIAELRYHTIIFH
jgi:hypothetical protein